MLNYIVFIKKTFFSPFFFSRTRTKIFPIVSHDLRSFSTRTFPQNPVPPVTKTFFSLRNSSIFPISYIQCVNGGRQISTKDELREFRIQNFAFRTVDVLNQFLTFSLQTIRFFLMNEKSVYS